jgi:hypothetical protein
MVSGIIDQINKLPLCESCLVGKQHWGIFLTKSGTRANKFTQELYNLLFDSKDEYLVSNCKEGMKMKELPLTKQIIGEGQRK